MVLMQPGDTCTSIGKHCIVCLCSDIHQELPKHVQVQVAPECNDYMLDAAGQAANPCGAFAPLGRRSAQQAQLRRSHHACTLVRRLEADTLNRVFRSGPASGSPESILSDDDAQCIPIHSQKSKKGSGTRVLEGGATTVGAANGGWVFSKCTADRSTSFRKVGAGAHPEARTSSSPDSRWRRQSRIPSPPAASAPRSSVQSAGRRRCLPRSSGTRSLQAGGRNSSQYSCR